MPLMACSTAPPRPCQNVLCRKRSLTRLGSSARSPINMGRSNLTDASTSALLVMALPMPISPSSVMISMIVLLSSSGFKSSTHPPSTVPPDSPVMPPSVIFMMGLELLCCFSFGRRVVSDCLQVHPHVDHILTIQLQRLHRSSASGS